MKTKFAFILFFVSCFTTVVAQQLSSGPYHTQYLCQDSTSMSWGFQCDGRLGRYGNTLCPGTVDIPTSIVAVSSGGYHTLYLDAEGRVWASGNNEYGQLGLDSSYLYVWYPQLIPNLDSVIAISAGRLHSLLLRSDGNVYACGRNNSFQLGDSTNVDRYLPVHISHIDSIKALAAGDDNSFFIRNNGDVYGCGNYASGKLGIGPATSTTNTKTPIRLDSISHIKYIDATESNSLFIDENNRVYACGYNWAGELGSNTIGTEISYPVLIPEIDSVVQVANYSDHVLFLRENGTVWIRGRHTESYVSGGTSFNNLSVLTQIPFLDSITEISMGDGFIIAEKNNSSVFGMGIGSNGEMGHCGTNSSETPSLVTGLCGAQSTLELENSDEKTVLIYPLPVLDNLTIDIPNNRIGSSYCVLTQLGQVVFSGTLNKETTQVSMKDLEPGMYYLRLDEEILRAIVKQ